MTGLHEKTTRVCSIVETHEAVIASHPDPHLDLHPDPGLAGGSIGRYLVIEEIGEGGMGRVQRAYDPKLQREVALKVVHASMLDEQTRGRMLREARAMAKLGHPNVVAVYDVDLDPQWGVVLAMEYVPGHTLRAWLAERPRTWEEIVAVFVEAGRGLAAAHEADLLHRDFKPSNVLVARDGRVRVTDFGLAKLDGDPGASDGAAAASAFDDAAVDDLTQPGVIMGTPRYMAPEQHEIASLTPAADQYAFCVALWEALVGRSLFTGRDRVEQKLRGPPPWPASVIVPASVVQALSRGLAPNPEERWPDMHALLQALEGQPKRRSIRALLFALVGALGLAGWGLHAWLDREAARCSGAAMLLADAWGQPQREAIEARFGGLDSPLGPEVWAGLSTELDGYAERWARAHTEACEATVVRAEQTPEMMDRRMACLQRRRVMLRSTFEVLASADDALVVRAHDLVHQLPPIEPCEDLEALRAEVPPPPAAALEAVAQAEEALADARALSVAGRYDTAWAATKQARAVLEGVDYEPIHTELSLIEGSVLDDLGRYEQAETAAREALRRGLHWRQDESARDAALLLTYILSNRLAQPDQAMLTLDVAEGLAARADEPRVWSRLYLHRSYVLTQRGDHRAAEQALREAIEVDQRSGDSRGAHRIVLHTNLANALREQRRFEEAEHELRRALELRERRLGPHHPRVASTLTQLGAVLEQQGSHGEAIVVLRRSLQIREHVLGPDHPAVADCLVVLGNASIRGKQFALAEAHYRRALDIMRDALGPDHPTVAMAADSLAISLLGQGDTIQARALLEQTWSGYDTPTPRTVGEARTAFLLARARWPDLSARTEAHALAQQALRVFEREGPGFEEDRRELVAWLAREGGRQAER